MESNVWQPIMEKTKDGWGVGSGGASFNNFSSLLVSFIWLPAFFLCFTISLLSFYCI